MKTTFTKDYMLKNKGCYSVDRLNACSFMKKEEICIFDIINSEIPTKDKGWFIARKCELTNQEKTRFAVACAKVVLEIFENKMPGDDRPRKAIEAAEKYLSGADISQIEMRAAAYAAAYAAADAAADDADDAAYAAAAYAAAAAAAAADAADDAAYAADAAADAAYATYNERLNDFFVEFFTEK